jgi:hypothetical protein
MHKVTKQKQKGQIVLTFVFGLRPEIHNNKISKKHKPPHLLLFVNAKAAEAFCIAATTVAVTVHCCTYAQKKIELLELDKGTCILYKSKLEFF